jgi:predicted nucleic acid-binding protein
MFVLDASAVLAWALGDESELPHMLLEQLATETVVVPTHWILEVTNGLQIAVRRGRLNPGEQSDVLDRIRLLPIRLDSETPLRGWRETPVIAAQFGLTIYDAAYLELALRLNMSLATLDQDLARAAREAGVPLFE